MHDIVASIREVLEESELPKGMRLKLEEIASILESPGDNRLKANKALCELEELSYNTTTPAFIRTQLWNITSMLETV
jgi:uncharacterized protein (UPF0147 family)